MYIDLIILYIGIFIIFSTYMHILINKSFNYIKIYLILNIIAIILISYYFFNRSNKKIENFNDYVVLSDYKINLNAANDKLKTIETEYLKIKEEIAKIEKLIEDQKIKIAKRIANNSILISENNIYKKPIYIEGSINRFYYEFKSTPSDTTTAKSFKFNKNLDGKILLVAGGGGGGGNGGTGGCGGGINYKEQFTFIKDVIYYVIIGLGGNGGITDNTGNSNSDGKRGGRTLIINRNNIRDTRDTVISSIGGSEGTNYTRDPYNNAISFKIRGYTINFINHEIISFISGKSFYKYEKFIDNTPLMTVIKSGGGSGAGGDGASGYNMENNEPAKGGIGFMSNITGKEVYYAGGGGGGYLTLHPNIGGNYNDEYKETLGENNYGGGGKAYSNNEKPQNGEPGKSGCVIIQFTVNI